MLKQLQEALPKAWTDEMYSKAFLEGGKDKHFRHALLHTMKALGKLVEMPETADHDGVNTSTYITGWAEKYLADIIICTVRMASEHPLGAIDLERAVCERLAKKMNLVLEAR
jgi:hypothetical protein